MKLPLNEWQLKPVLTAGGKPWAQRCYVCNKSIDLIKTPRVKWLRVDHLVRHKKCYPGMPCSNMRQFDKIMEGE